MDLPADLISESDYFKIAAIDLSGVCPTKTQVVNNRVWFFYPKTKVEPILTAYDTGRLKASLRDYAASLVRTKTKIFSIERERNGGQNAITYR